MDRRGATLLAVVVGAIWKTSRGGGMFLCGEASEDQSFQDRVDPRLSMCIWHPVQQGVSEHPFLLLIAIRGTSFKGYSDIT